MFLNRFLAAVCFTIPIVSAVSPGARADDAISDLPPYKLVRSLEYVQNTIARGDLSVMDMQTYLLKAIDLRLRKSTPQDFDDPRNINAALIYAMSGGNSETLADLVFNDAAGRFDIRITEALRMYLNGKSDAAVKRLEEMVPEYKTSEIGPYLALVAANSVAATDPANALKYFDWARLNAPGSIIEETALRRSVVLSIAAENYNKALDYSKRYARRYILSPYAGQFADVFVTLVVEHNKHVSHDKIEEVLGSMETSRQREVYLRIARKAALAGELDLTRFCAGKAKSLLDGKSENSAILADLYSGMADVPTADVAQALKNLASLPDDKLTDRDLKLRNAATFLASEMTAEPVSNRLAQVDDATSSSVEKPLATGISTDDPSAAAPAGQAGAAAPMAGEKPPSEAAPATANDPASQVASSDPAKVADAAPDALDEFVASTREKLNLIDDMLKKVP